MRHFRQIFFDISNNDNNNNLIENYFKDDNVDIIYVSSIPITEETLQYYFKLLSLRGAVKTGNTVDQKDVGHRYKIVIPEALKSFPVSCFYDYYYYKKFQF